MKTQTTRTKQLYSHCRARMYHKNSLSLSPTHTHTHTHTHTLTWFDSDWFPPLCLTTTDYHACSQADWREFFSQFNRQFQLDPAIVLWYLTDLCPYETEKTLVERKEIFNTAQQLSWPWKLADTQNQIENNRTSNVPVILSSETSTLLSMTVMLT